MERHTMVFELNHSYYLEKMYSVLCGRIDRFLSLITIFLGASVFASLKGTFLFGAAIALVSALSFVYQFGKASAYADDRAKKYLLLIRQEPGLDDGQLKSELLKLEDFDSKIWHSLEFAAYQRAIMALGLKDESPINLARREKVISWLAGGLINQKEYYDKCTLKPGEKVEPTEMAPDSEDEKPSV